jgi:uncharacterized protein (DUF1778 family)
MPYKIGIEGVLLMLAFETVKNARRTARIEQRLSPRDKDLIEHAAALQGVTPSEFVLSHSVTAARETIGRLEVTRLAPEDREAFTRAFEDQELNEELMDVLNRHAAATRHAD